MSTPLLITIADRVNLGDRLINVSNVFVPTSYGSNFAWIGSNVQRDLDDLGASFYDFNKDILPSVQDGYELITALTESVEIYAILNFEDDLVFYDLSARLPNFLRIFGIYNNNTQRWMWPTTMMELYRIRDNWEACAGDPYWYLPIDYKTIAFFPSMPTASGTFTVLYKANSSQLGANDPPQVPLEHQNVLEWYAVDDLLDQCQEFGKAMEYAQMVDQGIDDIRKVLRNRSQPNHLYFIQGNTI